MYQFPLERICSHSYEPLQLNFARQAIEKLPEREDSRAEATHQGLVLRAETERALERHIEILQDYYGDQIQIGPARVRYPQTPKLGSPHMAVRVQRTSAHFAAVKADLLARGATILDAEVTAHFGIVRATAPLEKLLGYAKTLHQLTGGSAREVMWLSHYAPVQEPPPDGHAA